LKVKNIAGYVLWETDEYKQTLASLTNFKAARQATRGKSAREEEKPGDEVDAENEEKKKKRRIKGYGMLGLIGAPSATAEERPEDMDIDDLFA